jgi:hypothetical protein
LLAGYLTARLLDAFTNSFGKDTPFYILSLHVAIFRDITPVSTRNYHIFNVITLRFFSLYDALKSTVALKKNF